jgi:phosphoheptose isomerase
MTPSLHHLERSLAAIRGLRDQIDVIESWGWNIGETLGRGGRLLAAGNGGSAAQAQHLTAELVGRYDGERRPLSAIALHAETSSLTAIVNDYGPDAAFARQVEAHGRAGDILVALSTSGRSPNVLLAATRAADVGMATLALTGPGPNPLAAACDQAITVEAASTAAVQEAHIVAIHLLCANVDRAVAEMDLAGFRSMRVVQ